MLGPSRELKRFIIHSIILGAFYWLFKVLIRKKAGIIINDPWTGDNEIIFLVAHQAFSRGDDQCF